MVQDLADGPGGIFAGQVKGFIRHAVEQKMESLPGFSDFLPKLLAGIHRHSSTLRR